MSAEQIPGLVSGGGLLSLWLSGKAVRLELFWSALRAKMEYLPNGA